MPRILIHPDRSAAVAYQRSLGALLGYPSRPTGEIPHVPYGQGQTVRWSVVQERSDGLIWSDPPPESVRGLITPDDRDAIDDNTGLPSVDADFPR
jgi:hypothetical protein